MTGLDIVARAAFAADAPMSQIGYCARPALANLKRRFSPACPSYRPVFLCLFAVFNMLNVFGQPQIGFSPGFAPPSRHLLKGALQIENANDSNGLRDVLERPSRPV